jgi:hypothetical protein
MRAVTARDYRPPATSNMPEQNPAPPTTEEDEARQKQHDYIQNMVSLRLKDAMVARESSGIEEIWLEDDDQYNGYDEVNRPQRGFGVQKGSAPVNDQRGSQRSTVFLNITKPKTDAVGARAKEMMLPHDDSPFEITPTPIPELTDSVDDQGSADQMVTMADGGTAPLRDVAIAALEKARIAAEKANTQIDDWFVEGRVYSELRKAIDNSVRIGSGVMKWPFPYAKKQKKWAVNGGAATLTENTKILPGGKSIKPEDFYPDASCGDNIHDGAFCFERDYMTARRVRELAEIPGYDKQSLADVLRAGPMNRRVRGMRFMIDREGETRQFDSETFEVFYYYGDIPPADLLQGGFVINGLTDHQSDPNLSDPENEQAKQDKIEQALQLASVSIVATLINDKIVRVSMNPLETGEFPFDVLPYDPVDGQPWGRGLPRKIAVAQRMLNASVRALMENAGMSGGPQLIVAKNIVTPWNGVYEVTGRKGWYFDPTDTVKDVREAFASVMIDSAQQQLQAIIEFALKMADELANMPMLMQGVLGNAPDTFGGMKMLENNATSPLKSFAKSFDDKVISPGLNRWNSWLMADPNVDKAAKGDHQITARASTALVQREDAGLFLMQSYPLLSKPELEIDPKKWYSELCRSHKFDPTSIQYDPDKAKELAKQRAQTPPPKEPVVQAAEIRAVAAKEEAANKKLITEETLAHDAEQADLDRQNDMAIKGIEREIAVMQFAGNKQISFEQIRAMLTKASMDIKNKRELFSAEATLAVTKQPNQKGI